MTRKDYIMIARALREARFNSGSWAITATLQLHNVIAEGMADTLQNDNPLFNRAKFLAACGVTN